MTRHLPECPWAHRGYAFPCICDRLRACEQRVLRDAVNSDAVRGAIRIAEQRTLDAAREAVERVSTLFEPLGPALAAIDALREWPDPPLLPPSIGVPSTPMWPLRGES